MDQSFCDEIGSEIKDDEEMKNIDFKSIPVCNSIGSVSLINDCPTIETFIASVQMAHEEIMSNQATTLNVSPKLLLVTRSKQKYRLIRKSPLKGSPVKSVTHILHKHKKKKTQGLSPRKLQFILPKVTKFSPRKKKSQRILRSKLLPTVPSSKLRSQGKEDDGEHLSSAFCNDHRGAPSSVGEPLLTLPQPTTMGPLLQDNSSPSPQEGDNARKELGGCPRSEEDNEEENEEDETEVQQQKEHLAAFLKASSTIASGQRSGERRGSSGAPKEQQKLTKQQRRLQDRISALSLVPDLKSQQDALVFSYLMRVREALTSVGSDTFDRFVDVLNGIVIRGDFVERVFFDVMEILKGFPDLQGGFVMFLRPDQAIRVGRYAEFCLAQRLREFVYELKHHFRRQPQILQKVSRTLQTLLGQEGVTSEQLVSTLAPILKLQPLLLESLAQILPWSKPQQSLPGDFEEISLDQSGSPDPRGFEHINLVDDDAKPPSENCPCDCHRPPPHSSPSTNPPPVMKMDHCISCALRFIDGRVFLLSGRSLRPAKVTFLKAPAPEGEVGRDSNHASSLSKEQGDRGPPPRSTWKQHSCPTEKGSKGTTKGPTPKVLSDPTPEGDKPKKGRKTRKT